MEAEIEPMS